MSEPFAVLTAQCAQLLSLIDELSYSDWDRPTRCPPMTVKELVVHMAGAASMTAELASSDMSGNEPNVDRATWWNRPDRRRPTDILAEVQVAASGFDVPAAIAAVHHDVTTMLDRITARTPDDVVGNERRCITAGELAGSRVLEFGVHTMDLGHATLRGERITTAAATIVADILQRLLDTPLPDGLGWDERTLILTGTGRRDLEPNERFALGPLAERFPLLR